MRKSRLEFGSFLSSEIDRFEEEQEKFELKWFVWLTKSTDEFLFSLLLRLRSEISVWVFEFVGL